ncbi:TetR family transcriptional regulator C-terminal domain-containing protein [Chachezhania sediminis]|uniref:TetR family transcriptional regulator C-terminal domain-containing protein n=1 Tax=Chachezhania sediminis TaxID=2599291 RepID=UPI00131DD10F|nr:TetR family transcriptional regulator C-terminal domain-containing protein [Chachezhania sediminis]
MPKNPAPGPKEDPKRPGALAAPGTGASAQPARGGRRATRIQTEKRATILDAALEVFSERGFRGSTVDEIATRAGLSKPNLLYYFPSKDAMYTALLTGLLDIWIDPLRSVDPEGEPLEELLSYVRRKLDMSRTLPRESRLFANEILQGAPHIADILSTDLKALVDEKAALIQSWMDAGRLAQTHPHHLIFSIWSLTQHYADFEVQIRAVMGSEDPFDGAPDFFETVYRRTLER